MITGRSARALLRAVGGQSKYRAVPTVVDGIRFASKREAKRYQELLLLQGAGKIRGLECQRQYELHAPTLDFHDTEQMRPVGRYIADFVYWDVDVDCMAVEDAKGFRTPLYRWKKKHFEIQYGIQIREV